MLRGMERESWALAATITPSEPESEKEQHFL